MTGGRGRLATALAEPLRAWGWTVDTPGHRELDITNRDAVMARVRGKRPAAILNLAAWTDVDACERDPAMAERVNGTAVAGLRESAQAVGAHLVHVSTDYVFDGAKATPYVEDDAAHPLGAYGRSKLSGEVAALAGDAAVVRVGWIASRVGPSLVRLILDLARHGTAPLRFVDDQIGTPTVGEDLAPAVAHVLEGRLGGIYHAANSGQASPYLLAGHVLAAAGMDPARVVAVPAAELRAPDAAPRPPWSVLDTSKLSRGGGPTLAPWQDSVSRLVRDLLAQESSSRPGAFIPMATSPPARPR